MSRWFNGAVRSARERKTFWAPWKWARRDANIGASDLFVIERSASPILRGFSHESLIGHAWHAPGNINVCPWAFANLMGICQVCLVWFVSWRNRNFLISDDRSGDIFFYLVERNCSPMIEETRIFWFSVDKNENFYLINIESMVLFLNIKKRREKGENFRRRSAIEHFVCRSQGLEETMVGRGAINPAGGVINFFRGNTKSALTCVSATG